MPVYTKCAKGFGEDRNAVRSYAGRKESDGACSDGTDRSRFERADDPITPKTGEGFENAAEPGATRKAEINERKDS